jgi:hypothetical protein
MSNELAPQDGSNISPQVFSKEANSKLEELSTKRDIEQLRCISKGLDITRDIVKTAGVILQSRAVIKRIDAQISLVGKEIEKIEAHTADAREKGQITIQSISMTLNEFRDFVSKDIPLFLASIPELDPSDKAMIIRKLIEKHPTISIEIQK